MNLKNKKLQAWIDEIVEMCKPDKVYLCDGSEEENERLLSEVVESGAAVKLNQEKLPGCYLFRSDASDVARVENRTFISSKSKKMLDLPTTGLILLNLRRP